MAVRPSPLPEERESAGTRQENSGLCGCNPRFFLFFRSHTTAKLGRITKARANVSPSPWGEGGGEGEQDTRSLGHIRLGLGA